MLPRSSFTRLAVGACLLASCKGDEKPAAPSTPPTKTKSQEQAAETPEKREAPRAAPIPDKDVQALVDTWLAAQNSGDFDTYEASYAARMTGVKRVGAKKSNYDRAGWLKDRKRMFRKKMEVSADEIDIAATAGTARVLFTQTWASGKFKDVGPKQLIIVKEGDALKIAREEMLRSSVVSSKHDEEDLLSSLWLIAPDQDVFVIAQGDDSWGKGRYQDADGHGETEHYFATRAVDPSKMEAGLASQSERPITILGSEACKTSIAKLELMAGVTPHFGYFMDEEGNHTGGGVAAKDVFDLASILLVAEQKDDCAGMLATPVSTDSVVFYAKEPKGADKELEAKLAKAVRSSEVWKDLQKDYESYGESEGSWDGATTGFAIFVDREKNRRFAVYNALEGEGCGDFLGELTVILEIDDKGEVELLGALGASMEPEYAYDLDGDGLPEFVGVGGSIVDQATVLLRTSPDGVEVIDSVNWDYQDCPC